jgi:hypothetical protein
MQHRRWLALRFGTILPESLKALTGAGSACWSLVDCRSSAYGTTRYRTAFHGATFLYYGA